MRITSSIRSVAATAVAVLVAGLLSGAPGADAASSDDPTVSVYRTRPIAIGVDSKGISYVGFATGGSLLRLDAAGQELPPLALDQAGPVDGVAVDSGDRIWVDFADSVSAFLPSGTRVAHWPHAPRAAGQETCPNDAAHDPATYGGIATGRNRVYVVSRCAPTLEVYSRTGSLKTRVTLPSVAADVAWAPRQRYIVKRKKRRVRRTRPAMVHVTLPDRARLLSYKAGSLRATSKPTKRTRIRKPTRGSRRTVPTGVVADRFGQVIVADAANHALYYYDGNNRMRHYRTFGRPPRAGLLNTPAALAQFRQDGGGLAGNLFIADTRNTRVQRWESSGGHTYWRTRVLAEDPDAPGPVANLERPVISGTPAVGETLACDSGRWSGGPTTFAYAWDRVVDDAVEEIAAGAAYDVVEADAGGDLLCRVTASTPESSAEAISDAISIPAEASSEPKRGVVE